MKIFVFAFLFSTYSFAAPVVCGLSVKGEVTDQVVKINIRDPRPCGYFSVKKEVDPKPDEASMMIGQVCVEQPDRSNSLIRKLNIKFGNREEWHVIGNAVLGTSLDMSVTSPLDEVTIFCKY